MSAFRFYSLLAAVVGFVGWTAWSYDPVQQPANLSYYQPHHPTPAKAGPDRIAQAFDR